MPCILHRMSFEAIRTHFLMFYGACCKPRVSEVNGLATRNSPHLGPDAVPTPQPPPTNIGVLADHYPDHEPPLLQPFNGFLESLSGPKSTDLLHLNPGITKQIVSITNQK